MDQNPNPAPGAGATVVGELSARGSWLRLPVEVPSEQPEQIAWDILAGSAPRPVAVRVVHS